MSKNKRLELRLTSEESEYIQTQADRFNKSKRDFIVNSIFNSHMRVVDKSTDIVIHLCNLNTEINFLKHKNPNLDLTNIERECQTGWQLLKS